MCFSKKKKSRGILQNRKTILIRDVLLFLKIKNYHSRVCYHFQSPPKSSRGRHKSLPPFRNQPRRLLNQGTPHFHKYLVIIHVRQIIGLAEFDTAYRAKSNILILNNSMHLVVLWLSSYFLFMLYLIVRLLIDNFSQESSLALDFRVASCHLTIKSQCVCFVFNL